MHTPAFLCDAVGGVRTKLTLLRVRSCPQTFITAMLAFLIASAFMSVYSVTADTMIFCFVEETATMAKARHSPDARRAPRTWAYKLLAKAFQENVRSCIGRCLLLSYRRPVALPDTGCGRRGALPGAAGGCAMIQSIGYKTPQVRAAEMRAARRLHRSRTGSLARWMWPRAGNREGPSEAAG